MIKKFIIVSAARTGSNYLRSLLGAHSDVKVYGEPFNLDVLSENILNNVLENPLKHLETYLYQERNENTVGFKLFYDHLTRDYFTKPIGKADVCDNVQNRFDNLDRYLKDHFDKKNIYTTLEEARNTLVSDRDYKIIHLVRVNKLHSYLSIKKAYQTDQWFVIKKSRIKNTRIRIDFQECETYFKKLEQYESQYRDLFKRHNYLEVTYEDLVKQKDVELKRIFEFLDIPNEEVKSVLRKQNNTTLAESIINYDEIKNLFMSTPWIQYFNE